MVKALAKKKKPHKKPESYEHVIKRFTAGEVKYLSAYFEVHVLKNRRDSEKIPPIVIKHETDPVPGVNGYKTDGSVLPRYFARYRKAQDAYKELLKKAYAESKRLFALYKGKRAIAVIEKTLPITKK